jgi:hypothetical protein
MSLSTPHVFSPSLITRCMPFARLLSFGILLTWLVGILLEVRAARAEELAAVRGPIHANASGGHGAAPVAGWGAGLLQPTLADLVRNTPPLAPEASAGQNDYQLVGDINEGMRQRLEHALREGHRRFQITSRGGEMLPARAMAELLNQANATIVAHGQCHSSCAYMWLATLSHGLGERAHLALHSSYNAYGLNDYGERWLKAIGRPDLAVWARSDDLHYLTFDELGL